MTDWEKHIGNKVYIQSAESSLAFYLLVLISNDTCKLAINYIPLGAGWQRWGTPALSGVLGRRKDQSSRTAGIRDLKKKKD